MEEHDTQVAPHDARVQLGSWLDVAQWLGYAADEFVVDERTAGYLHHVGVCVREEGERRYARKAATALA